MQIEATAEGGARQRLRVMSYNIQVGISTVRPHHYVTKSWKHILPARRRIENLTRIARVLRNHDIVGLQELDAGSRRTNFVDMTEFLADSAHYPFWYHQLNRDLGRWAQHGNGLLSRYRPSEIVEHKLPGMVPGRGALEIRYGSGEDSLLVMLLHLALGPGSRQRQLDYAAEIVSGYRHAIVMGDFNCEMHSPELRGLFSRTSLVEPQEVLATYPSWRPEKSIDHILVTPDLEVASCQVLSDVHSDHLPVSMELLLPESLRIPG